jgi:hypothetical protein
MGNLNRKNGNKGVAHVLRTSVLRCVPNLRRLEILQLHLYRHTRRHMTTARLQRHSLLVEVEICNGSSIRRAGVLKGVSRNATPLPRNFLSSRSQGH